MSTFISVGGFEYDDDEGENFNGLYCPKCDREMGYEDCVPCSEKLDEKS